MASRRLGFVSPWLWLGGCQDGRRRMGSTKDSDVLHHKLSAEPWFLDRLRHANVPESLLGSYKLKHKDTMAFRAALFVKVRFERMYEGRFVLFCFVLTTQTYITHKTLIEQ